ncbi:multicopper oxidase [Piedraia hortae CBS 480.64]|uniref:Multicopper oxidase n=1 Tax=Piedraia hortae CBS 480.64 TaxID=1314780 RepID=A0A6A7BXF7_9PEZI|nr:multicopper oxidase [Piedraia hortae CBS 480.64]
MVAVKRFATAAALASNTSILSTVKNSSSSLGTNNAPKLPGYLTNNPLPQGKPWGLRTAQSTNYYVETPNTGVTRYYNFDVTKEDCAPDGVVKTCLLVNGQYPGPTIEANWGDWFEITVTNYIEDEGTSIHWHGMLQKGTPYQDGLPGYGQCPIAPGSTYTYRFQADLYGTSWWHSHYSAQYASGLYGPMIIYGPTNSNYDEDLGPIMVSDWHHKYYEDIVEDLLAPLPAVNIPKSDNNLINGKNSFDCSTTDLECYSDMPLSYFQFTSGQTYRMRFINPSASAVEKITIDNHKFTVIANDYVEIEPYETDVITLAAGQRTDVLVQATGESTDAVWMRAFKPPGCWPSNGGNEVKAAIYYEEAFSDPDTQPGPNAYNSYCGNDDLSRTEPLYALSPPSPSFSQVIPLEFRSNGTNLLWYTAGRTFRVNYNDPMLLEASLNNLDFPSDRNVHNYGNNNSVLFVLENRGAQPHPMHLHGHNMFVLAEGACSGNTSCWDGTITRPSNPQRRDVQMLLPGNFIAVQWTQDNPGLWPLHCHIAWHLSAGLAWNVLERPGDLKSIPSTASQTCRDWWSWGQYDVVPQIDDGI